MSRFIANDAWQILPIFDECVDDHDIINYLQISDLVLDKIGNIIDNNQ